MTKRTIYIAPEETLLIKDFGHTPLILSIRRGKKGKVTVKIGKMTIK